MKTINKTLLDSKHRIFNNIFLSIFVIGCVQSIFSHTTVTDPKPQSSACLSAFLADGSQAFYDWKEVIDIDDTQQSVFAKKLNVAINSCTFNTPRSTVLPPLYYRSYNRDQGGSITVIGKNGPDLSSWRKLDFDYSNGTLKKFYYDEWYNKGNAKVELAPDHTEHTLGQINPEITLLNTGIENLDGSYYVNIAENEKGRDFQDFVMVSKTGDFAIYFTYSKNAPNCDATLSVDDYEFEKDNILKQNYPNPFSENTTIEYSLKQKSPVSLKIYNIKGQLVKTINENVKGIGGHSVNLDLTNQASGIYIYVIETEKGSYAKRMVLQK